MKLKSLKKYFIISLITIVIILVVEKDLIISFTNLLANGYNLKVIKFLKNEETLEILNYINFICIALFFLSFCIWYINQKKNISFEKISKYLILSEIIILGLLYYVFQKIFIYFLIVIIINIFLFINILILDDIIQFFKKNWLQKSQLFGAF